MLKASVTQPLTDVGPVFPFDVGVVVFVVGTRAGELNRSLAVGKVAVHVFIHEFRTVIAVKAEQGEGQGIFDVLELEKDLVLAEAVGGALFRPSGSDIGCIESNGVNAGQRSAAVMNGIGLKESRFFFIPLVGFDGDVIFEKEARFGGRAAFAAVKMAGGFEDTVDGCGRDYGELFQDLLRHSSEFDLVREDPEGEDDFKAFTAWQVGSLPDLFEDLQEFRSTVR